MFVLTNTLRRATSSTLQQAKSSFSAKLGAIGATATAVIWASDSSVSLAEEAAPETDLFGDNEEGAGRGSKFKNRKGGKKQSKLGYPGGFKDHCKESKEVTEAQTFTGGQYRFNYQHFPNEPGAAAATQKQLVGGVNIWFSPQIPDGASIDFSAQSILHGGALIFSSQMSMAGDSPATLHGRIMTNELLVKGAHSTVAFNIVPHNPRYNQLTGELEYKGSDFNVKAVLAQQAGQTHAQANYFQSLTSSLAAGVSLEAAPARRLAQLGWAARYSTMKTQVDGEAYAINLDAAKTLNLYYSRKLGPSMTATTSMLYNYPRETEIKTGFTYASPVHQYSGNFDSTGKVSSLLEVALLGPLRGSFSADYNHSTNESNFGYGFSYM